MKNFMDWTVLLFYLLINEVDLICVYTLPAKANLLAGQPCYTVERRMSCVREKSGREK